MSENLIDGLFEEINRVRELIKEYEALPNNVGVFGATFMKTDISKAEKAIREGDTIQMISCYSKLKEYED